MKRIVSSVTALFLVAAFSTAGAEQGIEPKRESFVLGFGAGWGTPARFDDRRRGRSRERRRRRSHPRLGGSTRRCSRRRVRHLVSDLRRHPLGFQLEFDRGHVFPHGGERLHHGGLGSGRRASKRRTPEGPRPIRTRLGWGLPLRGVRMVDRGRGGLGTEAEVGVSRHRRDVTQNADYFSISIQLTWYKPKP